MTDNIREYILGHTSRDPAVISRQATEEFKKFVPVTEVVKVISAMKRQEKMGQVKGQAAEVLADKFEIMETVGRKLLAAFNDEQLGLKDRIEAAKELRQWTRMNIDLSGIHDEESDTLFVIDADWSPNARDVN